MSFVDLAGLSLDRQNDRGSEPTDLGGRSPKSLPLSIDLGISGAGEVSQNQQWSGTMSAGHWIGIVLGIVILLVAIAVTMWCVMARDKQELSEEISVSMEFGVEACEEVHLALKINGRVACVCDGPDGFPHSDDMKDDMKDATGHGFEEAYL
jgi:hypothetical protein